MVMKQRALIENGKVVNTFTSEDDFPAKAYPGKTVVDLPPGFGINDLYDGVSFTKPPFDIAGHRGSLVRQARANMRASDWTQLPDGPVGAERAAWLQYRADLRVLVKNPNSIVENTVLPEPPGSFNET